MILDRNIPPQIHDAIEFDYNLPPISLHRLSNGIPLYWLSAGVQDVVEINWVFPAGIWYEPRPAVAQATAALLKNGTSQKTANQINEALEYYGASLKVVAGNDFATVSLHSLTKHLLSVLPIIREILTEASFPEEELAIYKQNTIQRLLVNLRQCEFVANQKIDVLLFGEQYPYGRYTRQDSIEALTREDLQAYYHQQYDLSQVKIFMAGNLGEQELKQIATVFDHPLTEQRATVLPVHTVTPATEKKHFILNDETGVQGAIRIGRPFINRHHPDFAPMVVLNTLFGGYFGSRLMSNIREDKGYTYGIYSAQTPYQHNGALTIQTEAGRDVLEAAVKEVYREMQRLREEPVAEEELLLVKNYLLGSILGDIDGPFQILQRWRTLILNGFTEEHFNQNIQTYKTIGAPALQELANKYLRPEDFYELIVV